MSLTTERIQIESKIDSYRKESLMAAASADMAITHIRQEASPLIGLEEIDLEKLDVAIALLHTAIKRKKESDRQIERLKKML